MIYADIALQMETTRNAVNSKINRLVVQKVLQPRKQEDQWEQQEIDRLVDLKKSGKTIAEISDILGKDKNSCYKVWGRWNGKQNSMRELFGELDNSRKLD